MYWKGMEPSKLLEFDSRLVAFTQELPFQLGKPLSPIIEEEEGGTVLVDYSCSGEFSPQCHIHMPSLCKHDDDDEPGREYDDELLVDVFANVRMADTPQDKDEEHRRIWRIKNAKRAKRRRNAEAHARNPPHRKNLDGAFVAADDRQYNTPIGNITEAALLIPRLPQDPEIGRLLQLTQSAMPSLEHTCSRSERHESFFPQVSHTLGGGPHP
jgi:hypothetical protein